MNDQAADQSSRRDERRASRSNCYAEIAATGGRDEHCPGTDQHAARGAARIDEHATGERRAGQHGTGGNDFGAAALQRDITESAAGIQDSAAAANNGAAGQGAREHTQYAAAGDNGRNIGSTGIQHQGAYNRHARGQAAEHLQRRAAADEGGPGDATTGDGFNTAACDGGAQIKTAGHQQCAAHGGIAGCAPGIDQARAAIDLRRQGCCTRRNDLAAAACDKGAAIHAADIDHHHAANGDIGRQCAGVDQRAAAGDGRTISATARTKALDTATLNRGSKIGRPGTHQQQSTDQRAGCRPARRHEARAAAHSGCAGGGGGANNFERPGFEHGPAVGRPRFDLIGTEDVRTGHNGTGVEQGATGLNEP